MHNIVKSLQSRLQCLRNYSRDAKLVTVDITYAAYGDLTKVSGNKPPPVIVMHCLMGSKRTWKTVCKILHKETNPRRTIVAVDARNHGTSPHISQHTYPLQAEDLKVFLSKHNIQKASLLGHSMGGRTAMYFALKYPELTEKIIIGDISPTYSNTDLESLTYLLEALQSVSFPNRDDTMASARANLDEQLSHFIESKGVRSFLLTNLTRLSDRNFIWMLNTSLLLEDYRHIAKFPNMTGMQFQGPTLFLKGEESDYIEDDHTEILKLFPNAKFEVVRDAGHWLYSDNPQEFSRFCVEFLNEN